MNGKTYNLNRIEIQKIDFENLVEQLEVGKVKVWNIHYKLNTKQGYTYKCVCEVVQGGHRRFYHLDDEQDLNRIKNKFEVHNKVIQQ